jgi:hypothetical protein
VDIPDELVGELARFATVRVPELAGRIAPGPAAVLGRLSLREGDVARLVLQHAAGHRAETGMTAVPRFRHPHGPPPGPPEPAGLTALRELPESLTQRLLGALEMNLPEVSLPAAAALVETPVAGGVVFAAMHGEADTLVAVRVVESIWPGVIEIVTELVARVAGDPGVAAVLRVPPDATGETGIAAEHGARHLALGVTVATAVLHPIDVDRIAERTVAAVGLGIGAAARLLRATALPPAYREAAFASVRDRYLMPRGTSGAVRVTGNRFALLEGDVAKPGDRERILGAEFAANGLVAAVPGGLVVRTGLAEGRLRVLTQVVEEEPDPPGNEWDDVVEVSVRFEEGAASVVGADEPADPQLLGGTPPWPGDYRVRVQVTGRDEADADLRAGRPGDAESVELVLWQAPPAPEAVLRRTDRLGHRLRGEPDPGLPPRPELAYRWVRHSPLGEAATVTIVTGLRVDDVLRAFGADPARPESASALTEEEMRSYQGPSVRWVMAASRDDAVLAVELNGWRGSDAEVITTASRAGRAASSYWNVNALRRLTFAEGGRLLEAFEPPSPPADPALLAAFEGLDFESYRDWTAKCLVALERFIGVGITEADIEHMRTANVGYRISDT